LFKDDLFTVIVERQLSTHVLTVLMGGTMTFLMGGYKSTIHKDRYRS
jgi:hypothetical protein